MTDNTHSIPTGASSGQGERRPGGLVAGALYPLRALETLRRMPELWPYVLVPIGVNILVGITLYLGLLLAGFAAIEQIVAGLPEWAQVLQVGLQIVLVVGLLMGTGFVLVRFGVVLGSPWYSKLSELLEGRLGSKAPDSPPLSIGAVTYDIWRALQFEIKKLLLALSVGLGVLLLNLFPLVGTVLASAGWITLGATIACLDFFDPPQERRRLRFRQKLALIRATLPASAGFGLVCFGLVSIPFINLLAIPLCITAGTLFYVEQVALKRKM